MSKSTDPLVRLVTRLVAAQAVTAAAVGLAFSRRHLPSVLITVTLVLAFCLLALVARTGARAAWLATAGYESVFFLFGLSRFATARYVGGTLFALIVLGALLRPQVAAAYGAGWPGRRPGEVPAGSGAAGEVPGRTAG